MSITTPEHDKRVAELTFASVYPHYINKIERKGRTQQELLEVIEWLTGFNETDIKTLVEEKVTFAEFFQRANLNENASLIKGVICGYRIEDITTPTTKKSRYLDKIVDELAKGKAIDKIKRKPKN